MNVLDSAATLISVTAGIAYINHRFVKLPANIGVLILALGASLSLVALGALGFPAIERHAQTLFSTIDFNQTVMHGMLSFLLFAGALHVNLNDLLEKKYVIGTLATISVVASTFIVGTLSWYAFALLGLDIPYIYCLLFGALISPTDPIAVLGILKQAGAPKTLEVNITGESLFNDGIAVVVFLVIFGVATSGHEPDAAKIAELFIVETGGGIVFGLLIGFVAYRLLHTIDNYQVEILITLALVMGGYALATALHLSGPVAIVIAGLMIGNHGRLLAMSEKSREHLDTFWELLDEILNAVLFVLIGLEVIVLTFDFNYILAAALAIIIVLVARFVCVAVPIHFFRFFHDFGDHAIKIMTWGGLRGGISVALALSIPAGDYRNALLAVTYIVVVFSIVVQGLTIGRLVQRT